MDPLSHGHWTVFKLLHKNTRLMYITIPTWLRLVSNHYEL